MKERHGWVLATFLQRFAAYLIDSVLSHLPLTITTLLWSPLFTWAWGAAMGRRRRTTGAYSSSC